MSRLNAPWNEQNGPSEDERFEEASEMCGIDFADALEHIVGDELPARERVEAALQARDQVDNGGQVLKFESGGMPWKWHLYELEAKYGVNGLIKFVLYTDQAGMWRVQAAAASAPTAPYPASAAAPKCVFGQVLLAHSARGRLSSSNGLARVLHTL